MFANDNQGRRNSIQNGGAWPLESEICQVTIAKALFCEKVGTVPPAPGFDALVSPQKITTRLCI